MKRKLLYLNIPFCFAFFVISAFSLKMAAVISITFVGIVLILALQEKIEIKGILIIILSYLLGAAYLLAYNSVYSFDLKYFSRGESEFSGVVTETREMSLGKTQFEVTGKFKDSNKRYTISCINDELGLDFGDRVRLIAYFEEFENKYYFDESVYYRGKNTILKTNNITYLEKKNAVSPYYLFRRKLNSYKEKISSDFVRAYGKEDGSVASAVLLGDKKQMEKSEKEEFYRSGIGHVMAVSGLHLVFLIALLEIPFKKTGINRKVKFLIYCLLVVFFALCVNTPISVVRAGIMLLFLKFGELIFRKADPLNTISIVSSSMLIISPYLIYNASFLMSVCATFGVTVLSPYFLENLPNDKWYSKILNSFLTAFLTLICIFPVSLKYFDGVSLLSPLTNVIILPFCMIVMAFSALYFLCFGLAPILNIIKFIQLPLIRLIRYLCGVSAKLPIADFNFSNSKVLIFVMTAVVVILYLYYICSTKFMLSMSLCIAFLSLSIMSFGINLKERDLVKVTFLGDSGNLLVCVKDGENVTAFDMTGKKVCASCLDKYIENNKTANFSSLVLTKNTPSQIENFRSLFKYKDLQTLGLPANTASFEENEKFYDSQKYFYFETNEITTPNVKMMLSTKNDRNYLKISSFGKNVIISPSLTGLNSDPSDIIFIYSYFSGRNGSNNYLMTSKETKLNNIVKSEGDMLVQKRQNPQLSLNSALNDYLPNYSNINFSLAIEKNGKIVIRND